MRTAFLPVLASLLAVMPLQAQQRQVVINRQRLSDVEVNRFETRWQTRIRDGAYWYDRQSGAWGLDGGPTAGWIAPGLELGGALKADASAGNTGVFVNGRELPVLEVAALMRFMPVYQGRWWVDGQGNFGAENGPVVGNLWALAQQRQQQQQGGRNGSGWSAYSRDGNSFVGGDGNGCTYFNSHDFGTSSSTSWASPGC